MQTSPPKGIMSGRCYSSFYHGTPRKILTKFGKYVDDDVKNILKGRLLPHIFLERHSPIHTHTHTHQLIFKNKFEGVRTPNTPKVSCKKRNLFKLLPGNIRDDFHEIRKSIFEVSYPYPNSELLGFELKP